MPLWIMKFVLMPCLIMLIILYVSSLHTNLRALQDKDLTQLQTLQNKNLAKPKQKPILLKIARFD
jgi:hypothetical protein